jgi:nitrogen fixation NifU-like protein
MQNTDLYRQHLLDHHKNPHNFGQLPQPDYQAQVSNPFCGDTITIQFTTRKSTDPTIKDIKFSGAGCVISRASASILTDWLKGKKLSQIRRLNPDQLLDILQVQLTPTRQQCALVAYHALHRALSPNPPKTQG